MAKFPDETLYWLGTSHIWLGCQVLSKIVVAIITLVEGHGTEGQVYIFVSFVSIKSAVGNIMLKIR